MSGLPPGTWEKRFQGGSLVPISGLTCPNCSSDKIDRKRRSQARFQAGFDNGNHTAETRYYPGQCYACAEEFYYRVDRFLDDPAHPGLIYHATEEEYRSASPYKLQPEKRHTTASEYSIRAASGADRDYLERLEQLKDKPAVNPNVSGIRSRGKRRKS
jgi:hypothetical protein